MTHIIWFALERQPDGTIPICVMENDKVLGWTETRAPSDMEYAAYRFVESLEQE